MAGEKKMSNVQDAKGKKKSSKAIKSSKEHSEMQMHVRATFNNTFITITTATGNVVSWNSAGACGFKGSRKSTPYAAQVAAEKALQTALDLVNFDKLNIFIKGIGQGREAAVKAVSALPKKIEILLIEDVTGIPFNGCRKKKERRV